MNAIKGSGPAGLSSIPRRRNIVVRPLLDLTHGELVGYLQIHGQPWREDEKQRGCFVSTKLRAPSGNASGGTA